MSRSLGSRIRKTRKQRGKSAPPLKASMKGTAKRGRQAPGAQPRAARLSKAAQKSAADTAQRMDDMGDIRAQQSARPQPQTSKAPAPMASPKSTATTPEDLAAVGYDTAATKPTRAPATQPFTGSLFENPNIDPMRDRASLGLDIPEIPDPIIPGVSGPPASFGQLPAAPVNPQESAIGTLRSRIADAAVSPVSVKPIESATPDSDIPAPDIAFQGALDASLADMPKGAALPDIPITPQPVFNTGEQRGAFQEALDATVDNQLGMLQRGADIQGLYPEDPRYPTKESVSANVQAQLEALANDPEAQMEFLRKMNEPDIFGSSLLERSPEGGLLGGG